MYYVRNLRRYVCMYECVYMCMYVCVHICMYVIVHTFLRAAFPVVLLTDPFNRRWRRGGPIARPPKSPNLKLPDIYVRCVQNTLHGNAKMTKCRDFYTSRTGSREESTSIFIVFARVSHGLCMQRTYSAYKVVNF
jgi:hypothetical protein